MKVTNNLLIGILQVYVFCDQTFKRELGLAAIEFFNLDPTPNPISVPNREPMNHVYVTGNPELITWCGGEPNRTPQIAIPIPSMYVIFTYIWLIFMVKYGKCR